MLQNKVLIGIGATIFFIVATVFIMIGIRQRQATAPRAQVADTLSCPIGALPLDPITKLCPSGTVPVPVYPTAGGPQSIPTSASIDGGTQLSGDTGSTSPLSTPVPTLQVLGICCMPVGFPTATPTISEPTPTTSLITPSVTPPAEPTPTSCPGGAQQLTTTILDGCSTADRCDFSATSDSTNTIAVRSLWSDGSLDFGALGQASLNDTATAPRLVEKTFTYDQAGTYDVTLSCTSTLTTCTKQIVLTDGGLCTTPTPSPTSFVPSPTITPIATIPLPSVTPTGGVCRIPIPTIQFSCPEGCSSR